MPRGRNTQYSDNGPSDEDLVEFAKLLGGTLDDATALEWPATDHARLVERVTNLGYAMRIAPVDGGRARAVTLYLSGDRKVERRAGDAQKLLEELRLLYLAAERLPRKRQ